MISTCYVWKNNEDNGKRVSSGGVGVWGGKGGAEEGSRKMYEAKLNSEGEMRVSGAQSIRKRNRQIEFCKDCKARAD